MSHRATLILTAFIRRCSHHDQFAYAGSQFLKENDCASNWRGNEHRETSYPVWREQYYITFPPGIDSIACQRHDESNAEIHSMSWSRVQSIQIRACLILVELARRVILSGCNHNTVMERDRAVYILSYSHAQGLMLALLLQYSTDVPF